VGKGFWVENLVVRYFEVVSVPGGGAVGSRVWDLWRAVGLVLDLEVWITALA
jgi:hypothetical protein